VGGTYRGGACPGPGTGAGKAVALVELVDLFGDVDIVGDVVDFVDDVVDVVEDVEVLLVELVEGDVEDVVGGWYLGGAPPAPGMGAG